jgi:hypothetical protein
MTRRLARLSVLTIGALLGNADGVMINYAGDVALTLPIARQHCAQYERVPVLRANKDNYATYACMKASDPQGIGS